MIILGCKEIFPKSTEERELFKEDQRAREVPDRPFQPEQRD
jgi:hypothetical protein